MSFALPSLPFDAHALEPLISAETLAYHHGKHHRAYVDNLNRLTEGTPYAEETLESLLRQTSGALFNNAAQHWNHSFYWRCLSPDGGEPDDLLRDALTQAFGSVKEFETTFVHAAISHFGSGWTWLVHCPDGGLEVVNTANADNPLCRNCTPLLVCDVWEHAYYIDYRNARPEYVQAFWKLIHWSFVNENFRRACQE